MLIPITNTPRDYAWGSTSAMAELLQREPTGRPEAEFWLGAHPGSPARILTPELTGADNLAAWIAKDPHAAVGDREQLPFLLKILAAESSLSLQAHPTAEQARVGFERENGLGIPLDAAERNYRDPYPKPEIVYALSENFDALCGFRPLDETHQVFQALGVSDLVPQWESLPDLFEWLLAGDNAVGRLLEQVVAGATAADSTADSTADSQTGDGMASGANDLVRTLTGVHPGDPGILCALLLNRVTLRRGQALYLPAGNVHAYLRGVGIELMSASDNVLRGGLTTKHVDVPELMRVLNFKPGPVPYLAGINESSGVELFQPAGSELLLARITGDTRRDLTGPAIALCVDGGFEVRGAASSAEGARHDIAAAGRGRGSARLRRGDALYVTPDEAELTVTGSGELFLATTP